MRQCRVQSRRAIFAPVCSRVAQDVPQKRAAKKKRSARKPSPKRDVRGRPRIIDLRDYSTGGRPTKYLPEYARIAGTMASTGSTDAEIARALGCAVSTLYRWKAEIPEFRESIAGAKQIPSGRVERCLYHRAVGYEHDHDEIRADGKHVTVVKTVKHYPPETSAMRLWLHNQESGRWHPRNEPPPPPPPTEAAKTDLEELTDTELDARLDRIDVARKLAAADAAPPAKKKARK